MRQESQKILADLAAWSNNLDKDISDYIQNEIKRVFLVELMHPEMKGQKFDIYKFAGNDEQRPVMNGVYHKSGFRAATDGHVLVCVKSEYPESMEGKILSRTGEIIEGRYPAYESIKPSPEILEKDYTKVTLTSEDFTAIRRAVKEWKLERKVCSIENTFIVINGCFFKADLFASKMAVFMETFGSNDIYVPNGRLQCSISECGEGWCLIMPARTKENSEIDYSTGKMKYSPITDLETFVREYPESRALFINK